MHTGSTGRTRTQSPWNAISSSHPLRPLSHSIPEHPAPSPCPLEHLPHHLRRHRLSRRALSQSRKSCADHRHQSPEPCLRQRRNFQLQSQHRNLKHQLNHLRPPKAEKKKCWKKRKNLQHQPRHHAEKVRLKLDQLCRRRNQRASQRASQSHHSTSLDYLGAKAPPRGKKKNPLILRAPPNATGTIQTGPDLALQAHTRRLTTLTPR